MATISGNFGFRLLVKKHSGWGVVCTVSSLAGQTPPPYYTIKGILNKDTLGLLSKCFNTAQKFAIQYPDGSAYTFGGAIVNAIQVDMPQDALAVVRLDFTMAGKFRWCSNL